MRTRIIFLSVFLWAGCHSFGDRPAQLTIVPRGEWGSVDADHDKPEHTIEYITIHHGGVPFTADESPEKYLKKLQSWSRDEKE